jgi:hypothetical protein
LEEVDSLPCSGNYLDVRGAEVKRDLVGDLLGLFFLGALLAFLTTLPGCRNQGIGPFAPTRRCLDNGVPQRVKMDSVPFQLNDSAAVKSYCWQTNKHAGQFAGLYALLCEHRAFEQGWTPGDTVWIVQRDRSIEQCPLSYYPEGFHPGAPNPYNPWGI